MSGTIEGILEVKFIMGRDLAVKPALLRTQVGTHASPAPLPPGTLCDDGQTRQVGGHIGKCGETRVRAGGDGFSDFTIYRHLQQVVQDLDIHTRSSPGLMRLKKTRTKAFLRSNSSWVAIWL